MTPAERAEKIFKLPLGTTQEQAIKEIGAQIREAILDDRVERTADDLYKLSYERGLKEGKAKTVEEATRNVLHLDNHNAIVRQKNKEIVVAVAEEREACAKIAEDAYLDLTLRTRNPKPPIRVDCEYIKNKIRSRAKEAGK
jgi:hypothetical protein